MIFTANRPSLNIVVIVIAIAILVAWLNSGCSRNQESASVMHNAGQAIPEDVPKGPHGGRLLTLDAFAVEITIFEKGVPPEFHVYPYRNGEPIPLDQVTLRIELARLDGQVDKFKFEPQADYLRGEGVVTEPHSFDVTVIATHQGKTYQWQYENYEGRTQIAATMAAESGIETEVVGPAKIRETLALTGRVQADPNRVAHVRARYDGMVKSVRRNLGDVVKAGEILAEVQSNESLQTYAIKAPISGLIVHREIQIGEATSEEPLFIITDLSQVWIEFDVFDRDLNRVQTGQSVTVETLDDQYVSGKISWISPLASHASQSVHARVELSNPVGKFRPGQFVRGQVVLAENEVPLAVKLPAIQRFRDFQVVFSRFGETYEVRMLELGKRDTEWVEVLGGLKPGTEYVTQNSYLIKADIEKSGASHDH